MSSKLKLYLASPFGFSEAGKDFMYGKLIPAIEEIGTKVIDPWKLTPKKSIQEVLAMPWGEERREQWRRLNRVIGKNNAEGIRNSHGLVAVLDGQDVDSGTASEIGYAAGRALRMVGYKGDFRQCSDNEGSPVNLQVEYFVTLHGGTIVNTIPALQQELRRLFTL